MCDWKKSRFETNIYLSGTIASPLLLVRLRLIRLSLSIYPVFEKLKILVLWSFFSCSHLLKWPAEMRHLSDYDG